MTAMIGPVEVRLDFAAYTQFLGAGSPADNRDARRRHADNIVAENGRRIDAWCAQAGIRSALFHVDGEKAPRQDADANVGYYSSRQLEYLFAQVLEKPMAPLSALRLFPLNTEVPFGATSFTAEMHENFGKAALYKGGGTIPRITSAKYEETWRVRHLVVGVGYDIFAAASDRFANSQRIQREMQGARDAIAVAMNEICWFGNAEAGLYGVLNYPWLPKMIVSTVFADATTGDDLVAALSAVANAPAVKSKGALAPTVMAVSRKIRNLISRKRVGVGADGTIVTVEKHFLATNPHIQRIETADELDQAGPGSTDGILCFRDDQYGIENVLVAPATMYPIQEQGFERLIPFSASVGGAMAKFVGNNILAWVTITTT